MEGMEDEKEKNICSRYACGRSLSLLGCATAFADAEGFSEEYSRFQDPDGILSGDEAEELNENWMKSAIIRTLM